MQSTTKQWTKENHSNLMSSNDSGKCPTCNGTGWDTFEKVPEGLGVKEKYLYARPCPTCNGGHYVKVESAKKHSNIPQSFYDKKYNSFDWTLYKTLSGDPVNTKKVQQLADSFINDFTKWHNKGLGLYIYSLTKGSGKTFLASCLCNEVIERYGIKTRFVSATQLLSLSQSADKYSPDESKRDPIKTLCECELLVIDDIGQKKTALDWQNEILFKIIDDRMINKRVTLFTSNIKRENLSLDDRIIERIEKITFELQLPEYNARSRESNDEKRSFLTDIGFVPKK